MNQTASKSLLWFRLVTRAKIWVAKNFFKPRESNISPIYWDAPAGAIALNFSMWGHVTTVITLLNLVTVGSGVPEF